MAEDKGRAQELRMENSLSWPSWMSLRIHSVHSTTTKRRPEPTCTGISPEQKPLGFNACSLFPSTPLPAGTRFFKTRALPIRTSACRTAAGLGAQLPPEQGWPRPLGAAGRSAQLIYDSFAQYLVTEKGYDKDLLNITPESLDFCCKGLVFDLEDGNFLKLAEDGTVLRASHGTKSMTSEEILETYRRREWKHFSSVNGMLSRSAKYYLYDNYFDLPGALLCARVVDSLDRHDRQKKYDFWKDMVAAIQHNYKISAFKGRLPNSHTIDLTRLEATIHHFC
ncbi:5'-nucleotidase domain-containing protein 1-like [Apteryx rowi]|uniref:5'-nucleotidase domain-containing protein 1-like n=1 Tax=Apteryx rowi TaxID=308060 RepID=UPI000E1CF0D4|nr:5'-nucleotidase domain-containing protein 1-like [Apteryx rowi]